MTGQCPGCGHPAHSPGTECEQRIDHGPNGFHLCLCLNKPTARRSCPPLLPCQGGSLGYSDVWYLQQGHDVVGRNGQLHKAPTETPCSDPPCGTDDGYPCDTHTLEQMHADGNHTECGPTCESAYPSDALRNFILWRAAPGSATMLDELLRRERTKGDLK